VVITLFVGSTGFYLLAKGAYPFGTCMYMTVISISTTGYGEIIPLGDVPYGRLWAGLIIILGMGTLVYFASGLTAMVLEIDLTNTRRRKRMRKTIDSLSDHLIVCGVGTTGIHVVKELIATRTPFIAIEHSAERIAELCRDFGEASFLSIAGDATEDDILLQAGIQRARGVLACLAADKDNLFVTITARQLNPNIKIIARARETGVESKLRKAGANEVVSPNYIGGMRMVSVMLRPVAVEFMDLMLRDKDKNLRIEEVRLPSGSPLAGRKLSETRIRQATDLLVVAARSPEAATFTYNPGPDYLLEDQSVLIVLGEIESVIKLRRALAENHGDSGL